MLSCPIIGRNNIKQNSIFTMECSKLSYLFVTQIAGSYTLTGSKSNNNNMKNKLQSDKQNGSNYTLVYIR